DCIVFVGSDFPFAKSCFPPEAAMVQVDVDPAKLGSRHRVDVAILGDAGVTMRQMRLAGPARPETAFLRACRQNRENWNAWLRQFATRDDQPLRAEPVFREINRIAAEDALFVTDVGNVTLHAIRLLDLNGREQRFTTSGLFATMGYAVPGGIAAKLAFPDRQVFTLSGDGGFAMVMQDIATQVRYRLPIINVVFSNHALGFIEAEQEDDRQPYYGVDLADIDFAMAAQAMGAVGLTVTTRAEARAAFAAARQAQEPVVINVKVGNRRPLPVEALVLDPKLYNETEISQFRHRYELGDMPLLTDLMPGD
ncbi:MAG: thiamine pyrophosphate-dependent enzyme, partial [Planctomycetes bacterium]|nr:thiamine pyrophosphate-dependent enzyme [Planctomycetota bacterium]